MDEEIRTVALLLLNDPRSIYITPDGLRAYALVYGKMAVITGVHFSSLTRREVLNYVDTQIKLHYLGKTNDVRKVK